MRLSASDHSTLLRLAASLPVGDAARRAILSGLKQASPETDQFWKNFSAVESMSLNLGRAVVYLLVTRERSGKWELQEDDKAWLVGTANRAHAERAKICKKLIGFTTLPEVQEIVPLLKVCQAAATAVSNAQSWSPSYEGDAMAKQAKRLLALYAKSRSLYPSVAHLLDDPE